MVKTSAYILFAIGVGILVLWIGSIIFAVQSTGGNVTIVSLSWDQLVVGVSGPAGAAGPTAIFIPLVPAWISLAVITAAMALYYYAPGGE